MNDKEEDILDKMLKERLFHYYQSEAEFKSKEDLVSIIISKEMLNLQKEKQIEALKLKTIQLAQNILDIKTETMIIIKDKGQSQKKQNANSKMKHYYQEISSIKKQTSHIKQELSISSDESSEEDLKIKKSNSILKQKYESDSNVGDLMKSIADFLSEAKETLISFLKDNLSFEEYKSNTNEIINSPIRLQMKEIQFYLSHLNEVQFYYKTLFVEYSNQLLQSLQNSIDDINKKITDLNSKIESLTSHF